MTKKPPRRSIISSFSALAAGGGEDAPPVAPEQKAAHIPLGLVPPHIAAGIVGATQRTLTDIRQERDRLQAQVAAGSGAELDPALIDPSPFQDRLPDDDAEAMDALKASMSREGQKVPVEVRRHPHSVGRYQLVYGHRRWRAAQALGVRLRAIIVDVDDRDLAIAQGLENAARQDLTWIEKALFAWRMEAAGVRARDIRSALSVDDPELARFRQVCRVLGLPLIEAIGRAPKSGRPRWMELAQGLQERPDFTDRIMESIGEAGATSSDARFARVVALLSPPPPSRARSVALRDAGGRIIGKAEFAGDAIRLRLEKQEAEAFAAFFREELPGLLGRFQGTRKAP